MGILALAATTSVSADPSPPAPRPFFVFDNGLTDIKSPAEQAALLNELGYDGICTRPANATTEWLDAMDQARVKIIASYVVLAAKEGETVPAEIAAHIGKLKGRGTLIWLGLSNPKADDETAVRLLREICDLSAEAGLEVALYPHVGCCTDTLEKCARLADLADRKNLGLSFTLCHFLAMNDEKEIEASLRSFGPRLKCVQISGCDVVPPGKPDWTRLIQPLGEGTLDVGRVIRCLDEIGYRGPVNLQCYQIKRPAREHLTISMRAWRNFHQTNQEKK